MGSPRATLQPMPKRQRTFLQLLPGTIVCFLVMLFGIFMSQLLGQLLILLKILPEGSASPISGIFVAIITGIIIRNTLGVHASFEKGIKFSMKFFLKFGIILLGLRLSIIDVLKLGAWGVPIVVTCILSGLIITLYITKKINQSQRLGNLIACGTGICGVTAIMAVSPVVKANDDEVSYAVANITIFGLMGMFLYPSLAFLLFDNDPIKVGLFLGTAIHDTAQVAGAALIYDQTFNMEKVVDVAAITKLTRNFFIIAVIPIMSYLYYKNRKEDSANEQNNIPKLHQLIPYFVLGFLALAIVRSIGDIGITSNNAAFGILGPEQWTSFYKFLSSIGSTYMLGIAMAAVGLSTSFKVFKGLGLKPFFIGITAAFSVGTVSFIMVSLLGSFISM